MNNNISSTTNELVLSSSSGKKFGLLTSSKPIKLGHLCSPPGFWVRILNWFLHRRLPIASLYRCRCGKTFQLVNQTNRFTSQYQEQWEVCDLSVWKDKGGQE
jgi:hypothetical protein